MHKNILTVVGITILFLGLAINPAVAVNPISSDNETFLEVNARVFGIWRIKFIVITLKNIGDGKVKIRYQDRGYEIYNSEQRVYRTKYVFPMIWYHSTLYPGLPRIFNWGFWFGFDDFGKILPNGEYFVKGWVLTEFGTLYSELVRFHLGKP